MKVGLGDVGGGRTILVHVDGVWPGRLRFRVWVDFTGTEFAHVFSAGACVTGTSKTELLVLLGLCFVEEFLVALEALGGGTAYEGGDGTPLRGHELCKVEELFVFGLEGGKE